MNSIIDLWTMNWVATVAMVAIGLLFVRYHHFKAGAYIKPLTLALALTILCFYSPLYLLSQEYLFSAHMVVHVLLLLVIGPLLVLALTKSSSHLQLDKISTLLFKQPLLGWVAGVGIMWIWHLPVVFNYAMNVGHTSPMAGALVHLVENSSLLLAGMLFSWPLIAPATQYRLPALSGVVYLFTACIGCSLLGLLITFAPGGLYRHFLSALDPLALNDIIVNQWQINQSTDQQIAGLIMWVPCCLLYVVYALYLLVNWFNEPVAVRK